MNTPVSLTSRVTTLANRIVPRESFHVTRPGSVIERRSDLRGVTTDFFAAMLSVCIVASRKPTVGRLYYNR